MAFYQEIGIVHSTATAGDDPDGSRRAGRAHKPSLSTAERFARLVLSTLDPRAWAHGVKLVNYFNYTHVAAKRDARIGSGVRLSPTVSIANGRNLTLGDRCHVGANVSLWAGPGRGRIDVGADTLIAPNVMITAANYRFNDGSPVNDQAMDEADITIGRDVWIGAGAIILPGAAIGDRAIIAAGTVVRGEVPERAIVSAEGGRIMGFRTDTAAGAAPMPLSGQANGDVLDLIGRELPRIGTGDLDRPLDDTSVDSFELISLRTAIEHALSVSIPDREWSSIQNLRDIARLPSLSGNAPAAPRATEPPAAIPAPRAAEPVPDAPSGPGVLLRRQSLDMPQMALSGLSEAWLFKEMGDMHWRMITDFLGTPSGQITDDAGERLYATFTRIGFDLDGTLRDFRENDTARIRSRLERFGGGFYFGTHEIGNGATSGRARTMSTFSKRGERGKNTSLVKGTPTLPENPAIPSLQSIPEFGTEYRERRAAAAPDASFECEYEILPPHDINGVGLLYFAAYPMICDLCLERSEGKGFLQGHSSVAKDVFYFANSEPSETLIFRLHERRETGGALTHRASLSRKSDGVRMAEIVSRKRAI